MRSPTERSIKLLKKRGYVAEVCEKWLMIPDHPAGGIRKDLFGCDIAAIDPTGEMPPLMVQTTSSGVSARLAKLKEIPALVGWLKFGCLLEAHGWTTRKKKGREYWVGRIELAQLDFLSEIIFIRQEDVWSSHPKRQKTFKPGESHLQGTTLGGLYGGSK